MREVAPDVYRLGSKYHNFYAIVDGGRATVIDAGCSAEWKSLLVGIGQIGLQPTDIEAVLLTHAHPDHMGFAARASDTGISVKVHEHEAEIAAGRESGHTVAPTALPWWKPGTWLFMATLMRAGVTTTMPVPQVEPVEDGETLDLPGRPRVVHTPGHTPGHAAFYLDSRRAVFTGDALVTMQVLGGRPGPQMLPDAFHTDPAQARASLARFDGLDTELVLPGHGDPWQGPVDEAARRVPA
jgi:glyoxylase-like metal-dependent hydrolase (beta-lactamase superfamily II)